MKPRPAKFPRAEMGRPHSSIHRSWEVDEPTEFDDDPQSQTPIVPPPTLWMLAHAGASWYSRYRLILVGAGAVLLLAVAFMIGLVAFRVSPPARGTLEPMAPAPVATAPAALPIEPATPPVAPPAPAAAPALPETIVLSVAVSPSNALILIDGDPMPSNPFLSHFPRSVEMHRIRAVAPGYQTKERLVSFADNVMMDLSLAPAEPAAPTLAPPGRERASASNSKKRESAPSRPAPPVAAPAPLPVTAPPASAPSSPAASSEAGSRPDSDKPRRRRIDPGDPYSGGPPMRAATPRGPLLICLAAVLLSSLSISPLASAEATGGDVAKEASRHFQRGVALYNEGDFRGALAEFRKAHRLLPRPSVLYNIGQTEFQVQEYAQALQTLERFLAETGPNANHRSEVQETVKVLRTRVGWIVLTSDGASCDVTVDDQPVGTTPLGDSLLVAIGRRKVAVACAGRPRATREVEVASGETVRVDLRVGLPAGAVAMPFGRLSPEAGRAVGHRSVVTSLAITGALAATTLALYTAAIVGSRQLDNLRGTYPVSPDRLVETARFNRRLAVAGDLLAVTTVAAAGLTTYLSVGARRERTLQLGLSREGLAIAGNF